MGDKIGKSEVVLGKEDVFLDLLGRVGIGGQTMVDLIKDLSGSRDAK